MDKDPRTTGPALGATTHGARSADAAAPAVPPDPTAARSPEEIRADIERTRMQVGDTVQALAEKTDVKRQARQRVTDAKATLRHRRDDFSAKARSTTPETAQQTSWQMLAKVRSDPARVALGGAALVAFLLGRLTGRRSERAS